MKRFFFLVPLAFFVIGLVILLGSVDMGAEAASAYLRSHGGILFVAGCWGMTRAIEIRSMG